MKIPFISGSHTNTCDPSDADQLVLSSTRARSYSKCTNHVLSEIMVRMGGSYSINVQFAVFYIAVFLRYCLFSFLNCLFFIIFRMADCFFLAFTEIKLS